MTDQLQVVVSGWWKEQQATRKDRMNYVTHTVCGQSLELRRVIVIAQADGDDGEERYESTLFCPRCKRAVTPLEGEPVGPYVGVQEGDV